MNIEMQTESQLGQAIHAMKSWLVHYTPMLISLALIAAVMDGVTGNLTAQWLLALILCPALAGWVTKHARSLQD